ncbi:hypothetical protein EYF80_064037 [Liparis tanakae]|uniref:Uncharacterized protein n=1 Tax=Liparis tanakae TaxID=230148 RepID=A0A4Z2EAQ3_9TELE|nr:hypothetical protein EYF80_064037 [Liparis tanakae]
MCVPWRSARLSFGPVFTPRSEREQEVEGLDARMFRPSWCVQFPPRSIHKS